MRVMNHVTRTVAVLAIAAAPTFAIAQTSKAAAQPNPAAEQLSAARSSLNKVLNAPAPSGDAFRKLSDLKTRYIALEKAASTASPEWKTHYAEIDRLAGELLAAPAPPAADTPVGTSGREGEAPNKGLDPAVAATLQAFRSHLKAFSDAMAPAASPSASASTAAPSPAAAPATPPAATAPPATPPATPPAAAATPPATTPPAAPATPAADAPAADSAIAAQVDQVMALIDSALAGSAQASTVSIDRATLEQMKTQLEQIKQRVKKQ